MSWREILKADPQDFSNFSDKSPPKDPFSPFSSYCHKDREIEKVECRERLAFIDYFSETEKEYFFNLVEFMESPKHGMDKEMAEKEAWAIVDEYRLRKTTDM